MKKLLFPLLFLLIAARSTGQTTDTYWWNETVFYEIFVRSFYDSDGDGIGDFQGLLQKLDYLNDGDPETDTDLGITGIWLMPISQSPSYHGYDVTDYRSINSDYGTLADFQAFVQAAHDRGIKVIVDLVMNHSSSQHPWFLSAASDVNSPYRDWYIWEEENPGYNGPWGQPVWHWNNGYYYFGLFWSGMPDLNYHQPDAKAEMFDVASWWLDSMQVDGFRLDAIKHLFEDGPIMENVPDNFLFLEDFRDHYEGVKPGAMTVGEVWAPTAQVLPYIQGDRLNYCFEFSIAQSILSGLQNAQASGLRSTVEQAYSQYPFLQFAPFLTNHDQDRVFSQLGLQMPKMKQAASILLSLPGIPYLYYGEEIGMVGTGAHEYIRTPMQWTDGQFAGFSTATPWFPLHVNYGVHNVADMQANPASLWRHYAWLIRQRNQIQALRTGAYESLSTNNEAKAFAFARYDEDALLLAIHHLGGESWNAPTLSLDQSPLSAGVYQVQDLLTGELVADITLNADGGFTGYQPISKMDPNQSMLLRVGIVSGLELPKAAPEVEVGPNPTQGALYVEGLTAPATAIELRSSTGELLQTWSVKSARAILDLQAYTPGIYYLVVRQGAQRSVHRVVLLP